MIFDRKFFVLSPEFFALKCFSIFIEKFAVFHGFSMILSVAHDYSMFFYMIVVFEYAFDAYFLRGFLTGHCCCLVLVWLLNDCKNGIKS